MYVVLSAIQKVPGLNFTLCEWNFTCDGNGVAYLQGVWSGAALKELLIMWVMLLQVTGLFWYGTCVGNAVVQSIS